jgi:nucleotide-binding universal stress UspA family protein
MKELVVGLDGSRDSRRALRWAAALAERAGVPLRAVEAWSYPPLTVVPGWSELVSPAEMDDRTVEGLRAVLASVLDEVPVFVTAEALRGPRHAPFCERSARTACSSSAVAAAAGSPACCSGR